MKRITVFSGVAALAAVVALAACNNGGNNGGIPTATATCAPGGQAALVNPAPGSSVTASSLTAITIAVSTPLPTTGGNWNLILSTDTNPNDGAQTANVLFAVATPPPGSATPSFANPIYEQVQLAAPLQAATYNVFLNQQAVCVPFGPIGSFTAQ